MKKIQSIEALFLDIGPDCTILTPNRRLAATIRTHYHHYQLEHQQQCWPTIDVLPITNWIERIWLNLAKQTFSTLPLLLSSNQEQFLWESIIAETANEYQLLQVGKTAELIKSAYNLLQQWQINIDHPLFSTTEDYLVLQRSILRFQQYCAEKNWTTSASLPKQLIGQSFLLPKKIILFGFTELSPLWTSFFTYCEQVGTNTPQIELEFVENNVARIGLPKQEDELIAMARWAKTIWQQYPNKTIACIIPNLEKNRNRVWQIFNEIFSAHHEVLPFNISAGNYLAHYPIIQAALQILSLHTKSITIDKLSFLLNSPFIGDAEKEEISRAKLDGSLRQKNIYEFTLSSQLKLLATCSLFTKRLEKLLTALTELTTANKQHGFSHSEWAHIFTNLLDHMGWPGERSLNSEEYQIVDQWLGLLTEFSSLDYIANNINYFQALQMLQKMAQQKLFQPKTPTTSIQILRECLIMGNQIKRNHGFLNTLINDLIKLCCRK